MNFSKNLISLIVLSSSILLSLNCYAKNYRMGPSSKNKTVVLTFDDGPDSINTPKILDILDKHNVKATFFVVGRNIRGKEKIIKRMVCSGHVVANHSWAHKSMKLESYASTLSSIQRTEGEIIRASGTSLNLYRPPYGDIVHGRDIAINRELGMDFVMWSVDTLDWRGGDWVTRSRKNVHGGAIILMHDIHHNTVKRLDDLLYNLSYDGYTVVPITDFIPGKGGGFSPKCFSSD